MLWQEWWVWIVAGIALAFLEVIAPGYVLLGFAIGVAAVGGLIWAGLLGTSLPTMLLIAAIISLLAWLVLRKIFGLKTGQVKVWERDINDDK